MFSAHAIDKTYQNKNVPKNIASHRNAWRRGVDGIGRLDVIDYSSLSATARWNK